MIKIEFIRDKWSLCKYLDDLYKAEAKEDYT